MKKCWVLYELKKKKPKLKNEISHELYKPVILVMFIVNMYIMIIVIILIDIKVTCF
jgi:hypothetical protein